MGMSSSIESSKILFWFWFFRRGKASHQGCTWTSCFTLYIRHSIDPLIPSFVNMFSTTTNIGQRRKKERRLQQQQPTTLRLPYTLQWDGVTMADFQQKLNNLLQENVGDHPKMKDFSIKIWQDRTSFPFNELLVQKRSDIRLLQSLVQEEHK